jgi:ATP-dependent Lon protease
MEIVPVSRMDQVIEHALVRLPERIEWEETAVPSKPAPAAPDEDQPGLIAH